MRDDGVKTSVGLDLTQVSIMLYCDQRIISKRRQRESIATLSQRFGIERRSVISEERLHNVEDRRLTRTRLTVEDKELVNLTAVASQDSPDTPFNLLSLLRVVERVYELVPIHRLAIRQRVWQPERRVILLPDWCVCKYRLAIERVIGIDHVLSP